MEVNAMCSVIWLQGTGKQCSSHGNPIAINRTYDIWHDFLHDMWYNIWYDIQEDIWNDTWHGIWYDIPQDIFFFHFISGHFATLILETIFLSVDFLPVGLLHGVDLLRLTSLFVMLDVTSDVRSDVVWDAMSDFRIHFFNAMFGINFQLQLFKTNENVILISF